MEIVYIILENSSIYKYTNISVSILQFYTNP